MAEAIADKGLSLLTRFRASRWAWLEPWYDWGSINAFRVNVWSVEEEDASEFEVHFLKLQWLGLYLEFEIGRVPKVVDHG